MSPASHVCLSLVNSLVFDSFSHCLQIHWILNVFVIVWNLGSRHGLLERPAALVVLDERENVIELDGEHLWIAVFLDVP